MSNNAEYAGIPALAMTMLTNPPHDDKTAVTGDGIDFTVDTKTKIITNVSGKREFAVGDHDSERLTFQMDRYIEGHDMLLSNIARVHSFNGDTPNIYDIGDMVADESNPNKVIFSWLLSSAAIIAAGPIRFALRFKCTDDTGKETYSWGTKINEDMSVFNTLENSETVVRENVDILKQWENDLFGAGESAISGIHSAAESEKQQIKQKGAEIIGSIPDDYNALATDVSELKGEITDKATLENGVVKFWKTSTEENRTDTLLYSVDISSIGGTGGSTVYGFHVNSNESDPSACVTYLRDAVGMTPAKMDFTNGKFDWGSWRDAFFIPKPCMLRSDGTVAYYLNENNYALKEDGTASDISNDSFDGNAMMEWGKDHKRIWYKIVADANDATSYSVYIADHKEDKNYVAWSFYNKNDELMEHFYTPIYSGSLDSDNKLRSLSGKSIMQSKTGTEEISYAKANGDGWNIEVWADKLLMFLLLYLMGKSLDVQGTYGQGHSTMGSSVSHLINTGTLDDKGLFFGYSDTDKKVKVFGMEDQWAEQMNRCCGLILDNGIYKYKLTEGTADGSTVIGYPTDNTNGMLDGGQSPTANGYINKFAVTGDTILPNSVSAGSSTYYCDYFYQRQSGVLFAFIGGSSMNEDSCGFCVVLDGEVGVSSWFLGGALSCKPLAW